MGVLAGGGETGGGKLGAVAHALKPAPVRRTDIAMSVRMKVRMCDDRRTLHRCALKSL